ncbi:unnamed protein product [Amoebophrya sp. A120]|nr:unnamed protein product [Amoebophrya sp. A120]|eukprot:GSA120T00006287001.1
MSSPSTRRQCDFHRLIMAGYEVELNDGNTQDFHVVFHGPKDTIYEGAIYRAHVELPEQYPFASPGIGFEPNTMFHPNVDEKSGSVCLDVINQTWTPLYSLVNVFEVFLPQLLTYPNPQDPLNSDAAALYLKDTKAYEAKVRSYVEKSRQKYEARKRQKLEDMTACSMGSTDEPPSSIMEENYNPIEMTVSEAGGHDDLDCEFD